MHLKTIQACSFRNIFDVLKDIINDINIYFDHTGVHIQTLDTARVSLVQMILRAENFEEYSCPQSIIAGINVTNTYKLLKGIGPQDTLTIDIDSCEYMTMTIFNQTRKSTTQFKLKLLDINEELFDVPEIEMDIVTTLPSQEFQRMCRDMGNLSNDIRIDRNDKAIIFSCTGDFAHQTTTIECPESAPKIGNVYSLKYINLFTKTTSLSSSIQLFQSSKDDNLPLVLKYSIANLGDIKYYLAPKND